MDYSLPATVEDDGSTILCEIHCIHAGFMIMGDLMSDAARKTDYLAYLHSFRGFAILCIVGAHAWSMLGFTSGAETRLPDYIWLYATTETLFHGSTLFFALISGILYTRVLRGKSWRSFYSSKWTNVVLPYAFITLLLTALAWPEYLAYGKANHIEFFFPQELLTNIASGRAQGHLWYIPVLCVLFALTPPLDRLLRFGNGFVVMLLALLPLVVSRTTYPDLLSVQSVIYFLGAYAFGMLLGERLQSMLALIQRHLRFLLALLVISTIGNFLLFLWDYVPVGLTSAHQSVVYIQKLTLALVMLNLLHARGLRQSRFLGVLGTYSFSLYFLHLTPIWMLSEAFGKRFPDATLPGLALGGLLIYLLSIALCLLLSMGLRRMLGRHSRMLIGT